MPHLPRSRSRFTLTVLLAALTCGCTTPAPGPRSTLDPGTGVSLTVVEEPLVLARDRRDIAAQARDYVTLVAAEVNEAGNRRIFLAAHQWSTIDARAADVHPVAGQDLLLVVDGRDFLLVPALDAVANGLRRHSALGPPENAQTITTLYATDLETLGYIASGQYLSASFPESFALPFTLWTDGRPALARLVGSLQTNPAAETHR